MHALLYVCSRLKELALLSHSQLIAGIDTPPNCLDRDCVGRRRTGTRHGNVYRSIREKQGIVVYRQRVLQTVTSLRVVSLVFRGHDLLKITNINPQQEARFLLWKKLDYLRERRKWSLGLGQLLKGAWPSREIKKATISEFNTFLKINKSRKQFLLRLTLFYPIYG